jgi:hypothetical protein
LGLSCLKTTTRFGFVIKNWLSSPQIGDEIRSRRQKTAFPSPNWRREYVSSSKLGVSCLKLVTRLGFVVKIERFLPQIGDEIRPRRQKTAFLSSNWRREGVSSSKNSISLPKMVTRLGFVAKIEYFSPQNGDEIRFRRQKLAFFSSKW